MFDRIISIDWSGAGPETLGVDLRIAMFDAAASECVIVIRPDEGQKACIDPASKFAFFSGSLFRKIRKIRGKKFYKDLCALVAMRILQKTIRFPLFLPSTSRITSNNKTSYTSNHSLLSETHQAKYIEAVVGAQEKCRRGFQPLFGKEESRRGFQPLFGKEESRRGFQPLFGKEEM